MKLFMGCILAASLFPAMGAVASHKADTRHEIQDNYHRFTSAETSKQYERIKKVTDSFFAPDFVLKLPSGKSLTHAEFLHEMELTCGELRTVSENAFHPRSIVAQSGKIVENGIYILAASQTDPDGNYGAVGLVHNIKETRTYQSTWALADGHWRLQSTQILSVTRVVDGKPHK